MFRRRKNPRSLASCCFPSVGHRQFLDSLRVLKSYLGVVPVVLSKLALLTKLKQDGCTKHRLFGRWKTASTSSRFTAPWSTTFVCGRVHTPSIVFNVFSMGGKSSPNICGKFAAAIGRVVSSVFNVDEFRCEICITVALLAIAVLVVWRT